MLLYVFIKISYGIFFILVKLEATLEKASSPSSQIQITTVTSNMGVTK